MANQYPDWTALTDEQLDGAFAAYYDAKMFAFIQDSGLQSEITSRVSSRWSFMTGTVGVNRFPKYAARSGFSTASAQSDVAGSTRNLGKNIATAAGTTVTTIRDTLQGLIWPIAIIGGIALIVVLKK